MTRVLVPSLIAALLSGACGDRHADPVSEAPPPPQIEQAQDGTVIHADHPDQFPLVTAAPYASRSELVVTGVVAADVSRNVPVIALASGRVVNIQARLGDTVEKGQLLLTIQSDDVSGSYAAYRKAVADETLARTQLARTQDLLAHGGRSLSDVQVAQNAEDDARVDVETAAQHLRLLGTDPNTPNTVINVYAPVSGVITDQEVTNAAGVQALGPSPFTISDLSQVWVVCDVYENDVAHVRLGDASEIRLKAYPDQVFRGQVSNIGAILDPTLRTAKVRIEVRNPGLMRLGMFVTATFHGQTLNVHAEIPTTAILHLHDREWVFVAAGAQTFRRVEIASGVTLPEHMQEVLSGLQPGTQVIRNALVFQNASEQ
jgi:cobalt-zinc-cadmium efflux system membrane fusion protein